MSLNDATVMIVDDDASVCKSLARLIQSAGMKAQTYPSAVEFLAQPLPQGLACLVLDIRMPGLGGLDVQEELNRRSWQIPTIFITGHGDVPTSVKAMKGGAVDFLIKPFKNEDVLNVIEGALHQERSRLASQSNQIEGQRRLATLTPRERQVLLLVLQGKMNKEIAGLLGAAERTIKVHRGRVMRKMKVRSAVELLHALKHVRI